MKLANHYNRASIFVTISVLLIGAVIYFFAINYIAQTQLDRDLTEEIDEINDFIKLKQELPKQVDFDEDITVFNKTHLQQIPRRYFDTTYNNAKEKKIEKGRAVTGLIVFKGENYQVIITESKASTEYLIQIISVITVLLMMGLLIILFLTNRYILNGLWRPFYDTLGQLKAYDVSENEAFALKENKVDEFSELNTAVNIMSSRVKHDFKNLKQFTENASHEMMTPLAVITSKLDTLIQDESLKPDQFDQLTDIYASTNKLSRLNQSLLLLVKIDNNLMDDAEPVRLDLVIAGKIKYFNDLLQSKHQVVSQQLVEKEVVVSKQLIDILLNNLFSNAIRHNVNYGKIMITLTADALIFENTGVTVSIDTDTIFERFKKGNGSDGTGLGLTLVKNICSLYSWQVSYQFTGDLHSFKIMF